MNKLPLKKDNLLLIKHFKQLSAIGILKEQKKRKK